MLLRMLLGRALNAEAKVELLNFEKGGLNNEKERSDLYRVLLGISHRVDKLEEILSAGSNIELSGSRNGRWKAILNLKSPIVRQFRSRIIKAGMTKEIFAKTVQQIYQERNERAGHGDVSLPEVLKDNNVKEVLKQMKIPKDEHAIRTIQLLISPLTLPSTTIPKEVN
ncbi:hypothetical protein U1Q18_051245 [Sarracenia purpurea var. burkii]